MLRFRYIFIALMAALIVVMAVAVDWRFWKRWYTMPADPGEWPASYYSPTVAIAGQGTPFFPEAAGGKQRIATAAIEAAADWAEAHNSAALLVLHRGAIELERYWQDIGPDTLFSGRAMTRSMLAPLLAIALAEGHISSVDDRLGQYLSEWGDDPRGEITLRQLLWNVSGLENPPLAGDPDPFAKNARLSLGSNFRTAALSFELANVPGEFFAISNANAQLLGAVLEAATGVAYEQYLQDRLWAPMGAGNAELYMDRRGGMPAVYCCFRATPRDWLRLGAILLNDGALGDRQLWPAGWLAEMTQGSPANPNYGFQIWVGNPAGEVREYTQGTGQGVTHGPAIDTDPVYFLEGGGFRTLYLLPAQDLVILRLGYFHDDWQTSALPNIILSGLDES